MKRNIFKDFVWDKDGNGDYEVTCLVNGNRCIAIPNIDRKHYCIHGSKETRVNAYGQVLPKLYTKFEVMEYLMKTED